MLMALVKFGGGIIQMSGSIAGNTFARNKGGNYVRARTTPVNPNTDRQVAVRSALTDLTVLWSNTLTAAQRTAWNLYGSSVAMTNKLGEVIYLSGFNHFIRSNTIIRQVGGAAILPGPTTFELPTADPAFAITASEATQQISVAFDNTLAWASEIGAHLWTFQGSPQNAQRNFFAGPWRQMGQIDGAGVPPASPDAQAVQFAITEGQHLWVYARIIRADGRLSERFYADAFCAA